MSLTEKREAASETTSLTVSWSPEVSPNRLGNYTVGLANVAEIVDNEDEFVIKYVDGSVDCLNKRFIVSYRVPPSKADVAAAEKKAADEAAVAAKKEADAQAAAEARAAAAAAPPPSNAGAKAAPATKAF